MTLKELITLYIAQRDTRVPQETRLYEQRIFDDIYEKYGLINVPNAHNIQRSEAWAPAIYPSQEGLSIPFILFLPHAAREGKKCPLIIHTHGGPNLYMDKGNLHAELAWFVSHGYVVACPNYRGSSDCPSDASSEQRTAFLAWQDKLKENPEEYAVYGPEDVHTVIHHMRKQAYVDSNYIFLRGGSFGSHINAYLLAGIGKKIYPSIITGAHLSGGPDYPPVQDIPTNLPILITHSKDDPITPYYPAECFARNLLSREFNTYLNNNVYFLGFNQGGHHFISPEIQVSDVSSVHYEGLYSYLEHATGFFEALRNGQRPNPRDPYFSRLLEETKRSLSKSPVSKVYVGPTMGLLKVYLGEQFTGNIRLDLQIYLYDHFHPVDYLTGERIDDAGKEILQDEAFFNQMVAIVEKEEAHLSCHPDDAVMYHAADHQALLMYAFMTILHSLLTGRECDSQQLSRMRFFDGLYYKGTVDAFLKAVEDSYSLVGQRYKKSTREADFPQVLNDTLGYADLAIACNPSLISNAHATASCSLWWWWNMTSDRKFNPLVLKTICDIIGLDSMKYEGFFEKTFKASENQRLMQQIFLPKTILDKRAYLSQLWGIPIPKTSLSGIRLQSPSDFYTMLKEDPDCVEALLQSQKNIFENYNECCDFGDLEHASFRYVGVPQIRYLLTEDARVSVFSYFQDPDEWKAFWPNFRQMIVDDLAALLPPRMMIHPDISPSIAQHRRSILTAFSLFSEPPPAAAPYKNSVFLHINIQRQLCLMEPSLLPPMSVVSSVCRLTTAEKTRVGREVRANLDADILLEDRDLPTSLFMLCKDYSGYTYFDLLSQGIDDHLKLNEQGLKEKAFLKGMLIKIAQHYFGEKQTNFQITGNDYVRFISTMRNISSRHKMSDLVRREWRRAMDFAQPILELMKAKGYSSSAVFRREETSFFPALIKFSETKKCQKAIELYLCSASPL